ncbi:hypothetical protein RI543_000916 [Arxiozyma heterogenica]|uniref:Vesicle transport v-SNARE N-terminal domain-containing protein n=1 Tax=Arxiozyma heterogenica TaxID=278026 RepID=A0AAN7WJV1_9SACH|nr:hypothetical protein RI543_000916 [Kazachstania heterogenica]
MSNLLESYDVEFKTLYESTKLEISNGSSSKTTTIRNLEINKDDLLEILEQMNIEVNNTGSSTEEKSKWRSYLRNLKNDLQKDIVDPLNKLIEDENRNVLFSTQGATPEVDNGISYMDEEQRQQLLDSHHILNKTNKRLMDAQRVAMDLLENIKHRAIARIQSIDHKQFFRLVIIIGGYILLRRLAQRELAKRQLANQIKADQKRKKNQLMEGTDELYNDGKHDKEPTAFGWGNKTRYRVKKQQEMLGQAIDNLKKRQQQQQQYSTAYNDDSDEDIADLLED